MTLRRRSSSGTRRAKASASAPPSCGAELTPVQEKQHVRRHAHCLEIMGDADRMTTMTASPSTYRPHANWTSSSACARLAPIASPARRMVAELSRISHARQFRNLERAELGHRPRLRARPFAWSRCMSEMCVHFSDSILESPPVGLPSDIAESCHLFRMAIKNLNQADRSFAGLHCTTLILLERSPSASNDPTRLFLREAKLLAHGSDPCGIGRSQLDIGLIYSLKFSARMDGIAIAFRIPARHLHFACQRANAQRLHPRVPPKHITGLGMNPILTHLQTSLPDVDRISFSISQANPSARCSLWFPKIHLQG